MMIMLDPGQRFLNVLLVMVVYQRDRARDFLVAKFLLMLDELVTNHISDGERAVVVALFRGHLVELLQQCWRQGHAKSDNRFVFHG